MRTRVFDKRMATATKLRWGHTKDNPNPAWTSGSYMPGEVVTVVDSVNSRFLERSKRGEVINTPFSLTRSDVRPAMGPYILSGPNNGGAFFADYQSAPYPSFGGISPTTASLFGISTDHSAMITRVGTAAMARVAQAKYPGLVSAGELGETLRYLQNPLKTGLKLASSIERKLSQRVLRGGKYQPGLIQRRLDLTSSKSVMEEISSLYLELMYGMRPLVKEIFEFAEALTEQSVINPRETARAREENSWQGSLTRQNAEGVIGWTETLNYTRRVEVRAGCMYHFFSGIESSNRDWGMRITDIPSALWALTPSSFVADWFLNMNQLIAALTPIHGLVKDAVWTSVTIEETLTRNCSAYTLSAWPQPVTSSGGTGSSVARMLRKERFPTVTVGLAPTRLTSGLVDLKLSQAATLSAMLTQRIVPLIRDLGKSAASAAPR